ncbi:uncharacterized protein LOC144434995 [Glandiceps talaboti]
MAYTTMLTYLSAISYVHKLAGCMDPTKSFLIQKLIVAAKKLDPRIDVRLPISQPILHKLVQSIEHTITTRYQQSLFRAMFLLAFHGFLRIGEMTVREQKEHQRVLQRSSIQFLRLPNNLLAFQLTITVFKHNTENRPFHLLIKATGLPGLCPVHAMIDICRWRGCRPGPLFIMPTGSAVTREHFVSHLNICLNFCGLDASRYKGHSFRIGAASRAAALGLSDAQIRVLGRWKSDAFKSYIRNSTAWCP